MLSVRVGNNRRGSRHNGSKNIDDEVVDALNLLSDEHTHWVIKTLHNVEENKLPLDALIDRAASDSTVHTPEGNFNRYDVIAHHSQLPKLDEYGLINYNNSKQEIEVVDSKRIEDLVVLLELVKAKFG